MAAPDKQSEPEETAQAVERGRLLFSQECLFIAGAVELDALPESALPEIAFAGRSNVGKSSLINALTGRNSLARTSQTPGRTRQINFFSLGERLMLVDLPGHGYAKAPKSEIKKWTALIDLYLRGRVNLRRLCLLVDSRHGLKESDEILMAAMNKAGVSYQIIMTKADTLKSGEIEQKKKALAGALVRHGAAHPLILPTSAQSGAGIPELRAALASLA